MNLGFETEKIEFKKSTSELKAGLISLSSMLNKHHEGTLYFGVKDNGDICGQDIGKDTLRDISAAIAAHIQPQIIPSISIEFLDEKNVIKINCSGNDTPYSAYGKYYTRIADEDRELSPQQLKQFMQEQNDDPIIEIQSNNQNLTFNQLRTIFINNGLSVNDDAFLENLGFYTSKGKLNIMAYLLSDTNDISIKVVRFKGTDKTEVIRRNEYGFKNLITAMDQVLTYMEAINDTKVTLNNHNREEIKLFDFKVFKEAWQNACLHNSWTTLNPPAVYVFSDRIEIISTGGIKSHMTTEEFFKGISKPVNKKLQKIFGQLNIVEQTGHGVPLIVNKYGENSFDLMENFVNVTIPFNHEFTEKQEIKVYEKLNNSQIKIISYLKDNPTATIAELVSKLEMSDGNVRKILNQLKSNGYIERIGSNKTGYWKVNQ